MPPSVAAKRLLNIYLIRMRFWVRLQVPATTPTIIGLDCGEQHEANPMSICMLVAGMSIPRDRRRTFVFRSDQEATGIDAVLPAYGYHCGRAPASLWNAIASPG
jgi:hypothetical protein